MQVERKRKATFLGATLALMTSVSAAGAGDCVPYWDATIGQPGLGDWVTSLAEYNGELIAGGFFTPGVARWNQSSWQPMGAVGGGVWAFTLYGTELIAGGTFTADGVNILNRIARWDADGPNGAAWYPIDTNGGTVGMESIVRALVVYGGLLVAGGGFTTADGQTVNYIAAWDGSSWQSVGGGMNTDGVHALAVFNDDLVAAGAFSFAGGTPVNRIARWDGSAWHSLGAGLNDVVTGLTVYNGDLIATGVFTEADGQPANSIARWDGRSWHPLGAGLNAEGYSFAVFNSDLVVGGSFTTSGGQSANRIASWNGSSWQELAGGTGGSAVFALKVHGQRLVAGGTFTTVGGGQNANHVAELAWPAIDPQVTQSPASVLASNGDTVVFTAAGDGPGTLSYQWRKDGVDLADGGNISGANTPTLTISNVSLTDFGAYDMRISSPCGSAVSDPAALGILPGKNACPADVNGDGIVDIQDFLALLAAWGACP